MREVRASLVITVDTEPDDQWAPPAGRPPAAVRVRQHARPRAAEGPPPRPGRPRHLDDLLLGGARPAERRRPPRRPPPRVTRSGGTCTGGRRRPSPTSTGRPAVHLRVPAPRPGWPSTASLVAAHEDAFGARAGELPGRPVGGRRRGARAPGRPGLPHRLQHPARDRLPRPGGLRGAGARLPAPPGGRPAQPHRAGPLWEVPVSITPARLLGAGRLAAGVARLAGARRPGATAPAAGPSGRWTRPGCTGWCGSARCGTRAPAGAARAVAGPPGARIINVMFHSSEALARHQPAQPHGGRRRAALRRPGRHRRRRRELGVVPRTLRERWRSRWRMGRARIPASAQADCVPL